MTKSILEKAISYAINEQYDKAESLFHEYVVQRARKIHESNCQNDADLIKDWDESYMTEDDLSDDDMDMSMDDSEMDMDSAEGEMSDAEGDLDMAVDDLEDASLDDDDSMDMDNDSEMSDEVENKIDDMQDQLDQLLARFDELVGDSDDIDDSDETMDMDAEDEIEDASDDLEDAEEDIDDAKKDEEFNDEDDTDYDDISESVLSELEKINSEDETDGLGIGAGKVKVQQNRKSVQSYSKPADVNDAHPSTSTQKEMNEFNRETAPSVKPGRNSKNNFKPYTKVGKEGDSSALINKNFANDSEKGLKSGAAPVGFKNRKPEA